jgi:hypothetical protein
MSQPHYQIVHDRNSGHWRLRLAGDERPLGSFISRLKAIDYAHAQAQARGETWTLTLYDRQGQVLEERAVGAAAKQV